MQKRIAAETAIEARELHGLSFAALMALRRRPLRRPAEGWNYV